MKKLLALLVLFGAFALPGATLAQDKSAQPAAQATKADEAKLFILLHHITLFHIITYAAGQCSSYLAHQDIAIVIAYHYGSALIFGRRLRMPCHQVFSRVILHVLDQSAHRVAVYVHIYWRHE